MHVQPTESHESLDNTVAIIAWLRANSFPLQHIQAGHGFSDLQPLKTMLASAKVVGLGETTHGTREIFQLKHRLVEFLVMELGFNAVAFEASYAGCQAINDYILHGSGDRDAALTGQGAVVWDIEEIVDLLEWLRAHNQKLPDDKKVRFYGLDSFQNDIGRKETLDYLDRVALDQSALARSLFAVMATQEAKWPTLMDDDAQQAIGQLLPSLQGLIDHFSAHRDDYVMKSSPEEFDQAHRYLRVMQQWLMANGTTHLPPDVAKASTRLLFMAENLMYLIDAAPADAKFVVWEHNGHISKGILEDGGPNMGSVLQQAYGDRYFALGFEYGQGSCNTRILLSDRRLGDLKGITLGPPPEGSLPWLLSKTQLGDLILDLRAGSDDPRVVAWLHAPVTTHNVSWVYREDSRFYDECRAQDKYDAIAFLERTTGARPTANGLKTIAARQGL